MMSVGESFHTFAPATANAQLPTVLSQTRDILRRPDADDLGIRREGKSATQLNIDKI